MCLFVITAYYATLKLVASTINPVLILILNYLDWQFRLGSAGQFFRSGPSSADVGWASLPVCSQLVDWLGSHVSEALTRTAGPPAAPQILFPR